MVHDGDGNDNDDDNGSGIVKNVDNDYDRLSQSHSSIKHLFYFTCRTCTMHT